MAVASSGRPAGTRRLSRIVQFALKACLSRLANVLTSFRMAAALPIGWLIISGDDRLALMLFAAAALSDALDGYIAKRFGACSALGAMLDPLADKLLVIASVIALAERDLMPFWLLALVLVRDLSIVAGGAFLRFRFEGFSVKPLVIGKICTFSILVTVAATLLASSGWIEAVQPSLLAHLALACMIVASGIGYALAAHRAWIVNRPAAGLAD